MAAPALTAIVYCCDGCAPEYLPAPRRKLSEVRDAPPMQADPYVAIVHASCAADFVTNGFAVVPGIVEHTRIAGFFCPHLP